MPAKNSTLRYGNRDFIFSKDFYSKLNTTLSYKECEKVIKTANENVAEVIVEEYDGFKIPKGLGYLCGVRFIPKKPAVDWRATEKNGGKFVYFNNLDTFGYSVCVRWFRVGRISNTSIHEVFKFRASAKLGKKISDKFKTGKMYSEFTNSDFIQKSKLQNMYNKKYNKELKD